MKNANTFRRAGNLLPARPATVNAESDRGAASRKVASFEPIALFAILAILGVAPLANAGDVYVICASGVTITMAEARDVFLGEKPFAGSVKLVPADNSAAQADFLDKVMKMDLGKYQTAWTKKSFRDGATAPPVKSSDGEAAEFVKHTPGGCSYTGSAPPAGVTVVGKL